jgi:uncharacterized protein (TIGR00661 family)
VKRVLVAPLDWGLGHATRCIPIIREFQSAGCEVFIAGSGHSLVLLKKEFPKIQCFNLPGYAPRYPLKRSMAMSMALQLPRFMKVILAEHRVTEAIIKNSGIHLVISDNRYGCWSRQIPSIFITHQSNILMPKRFGWLQSFVRRANNRMMKNFDACWIPDYPGDDSLTGDLSSFNKINWIKATEYIGCVSRFLPDANIRKRYDIVAIFSGPEPQRTAFERMVGLQLKASGLQYLIVRGLPDLVEQDPDPNTVNFLLSQPLQNSIAAADLIIARSGYSTVMDLHTMGKRVIFIPTPGQTEQEYLAKRLMSKRIAFCMEQNEFQLDRAMEESKNFSGFEIIPENNLLSAVVRRCLSEI